MEFFNRSVYVLIIGALVFNLGGNNHIVDSKTKRI